MRALIFDESSGQIVLTTRRHARILDSLIIHCLQSRGQVTFIQYQNREAQFEDMVLLRPAYRNHRKLCNAEVGGSDRWGIIGSEEVMTPVSVAVRSAQSTQTRCHLIPIPTSVGLGVIFRTQWSDRPHDLGRCWIHRHFNLIVWQPATL